MHLVHQTPAPPRVFAATIALFALVGAAFGSWAARVPDISTQVGATHSALGLALFCISAGALVSMQIAGVLAARWGPGRVGAAGAVLVSVAVALPGTATSLVSLCAMLLIFGAATGLANVAANSLGVQIQQTLGRPVMSTMHAGFSFGGLFGALSGGLASLYVPAGWHLAAVAVLCLGIAGAIAPTLIGFHGPDPAPATGPDAKRPSMAGVGMVVVLLGLIAGSTAFAEGALTDWASLHLRENLHATPVVAASGYAAFSLAMACARLNGRRLIVRYGDTVVLVTGALLAAAGMLAGALASTPYLALAGFVLVGLGLANVFPLAIAKAGLLGGPRGVARASTVGYTGLLGGPPIIGFLAGAWSLSMALVSVSVLAVLAGVIALVVDHRLDGAGSVASVLRAQTRARLQPLGVKIESAAQAHGSSLWLLTDQTSTPRTGRSERTAGGEGLEFLDRLTLPEPLGVLMRTLELRRSVLIGVSYMIPFVVVGGLLQAAGLLLGGPELARDPAAVLSGALLDASAGADRPAAVLYTLGVLSFHLLAPALAGYIAYAIADRPGIMPGLTAGLAAGAIGAGFLGALIGGVLAGIAAERLGRVPVPEPLRGLASFVLVPVTATLLSGGAMLAVIGPPVAAATDALTGWLTGLGGSAAVLLGAVLGAMMVADLGGPLNKAAYTFAITGVTGGGAVTGRAASVMAAVMVAGMTAPLACWLATRLRPSRFTAEEREQGKAAGVLGAVFISEGAIPFAAANPLRVIPSLMLGGAVAGAATMVFGVTLKVSHGGLLAMFAAGHVVGFIAALILGIETGAACLALTRRRSRPADQAVSSLQPSGSPSIG